MMIKKPYSENKKVAEETRKVMQHEAKRPDEFFMKLDLFFMMDLFL